MMNSSERRLEIGAALLLLASTAAAADAIDGTWCNGAGRQLAIRGSSIVTPGGTEMHGQYTRHAFQYVVPGNEPASGQDVDLQLLNENTVHLRVGAGGAAEVWHRCKPETS
jgi:hypothetical protein